MQWIAANFPVNNVNDRVGEHSTQAMLDVFPICEELGNFQGIVITNNNAQTKVTTFVRS